MEMNKLTEKTMIQALEVVGLPKLPEVWNGEDFYLRAVGKVLKANNNESFVLIKKGFDGEDRIVQDFGDVCAIKKVVEVYPYQFLQEKYMPECKNKQDKITHLVKFYKLENGERFESMKAKELDMEIIKTAIQLQLSNERN